MKKLFDIIENMLNRRNQMKLDIFNDVRLSTDDQLIFEDKKFISLEEIEPKLKKYLKI